MAGTQTIGPSTIPEGATLLNVGFGTGRRYFLSYKVYGVTILYEVGDRARLTELFGADAAGQFPTSTSMTEKQFNQLGGIEMGWADEVVGADESIQAQINRGIRQAGFEDIPQWMRRDPQIMTLLVQGTAEEWSSGRIMNQMAQTAGFQERFPAFSAIRQRLGGGAATVSDTVRLYLQEEASLRFSLRHYRGRGTDTSPEYLGRIIGSGWSAAEADEVLRAESLLMRNPDALDNLNAILRASGMKRLRGEDMIDLMRGKAPTQVYEALNDALRLQAMQKAGLQVDAALAASFGEGVAEQVASAAQRQQFSVMARNAANELISSWQEVEVGKYGITRDEVIRAAFGEAFDPQIEAKLLKVARERQAAAEGTGAYSAYQDNEGRLVLAGLSAL